MRRIALLAFGVASVVIVAGAVLLRSDRPASRASAAGPGTGPDLSIGTVTLAAGKVRVQIVASGSGFDPYGGVNSTLLWDPAVFSYAGHDDTGSVIPGIFCGFAATSSTTGPHNGVVDGENVGCASLASPFVTSATGLITTFLLTPLTGCSPLHLLTIGAPDNDPRGTGSLDAGAANQPNSYGTIDLAVDTTGAACGLPTSTPTSTPTPTQTNTPTVTPTTTQTDTPTVTPTPTDTPTATPTIEPTLDSDGDGYPDVLELATGQDPFTYCATMRADVNMDGRVALADLIIEAGWYNKDIPPAPARYDQNADNKITLSDLIIMASVYFRRVTECPPTPPTPTPTDTVTATPTNTATPTPTNTANPTSVRLFSPGICFAAGGSPFPDGCVVSQFGLEFQPASGDTQLAEAAQRLGNGDGVIQPEDFDAVATFTGGQLHQEDGAFSYTLSRMAVIAFVNGASPVTFTTTAGFFNESGTSTWVCDGNLANPNPDPDCSVLATPSSSPVRFREDGVVVAYLSCSLATCPNRGTFSLTVEQGGIVLPASFIVVGEPRHVTFFTLETAIQAGVPVVGPLDAGSAALACPFAPDLPFIQMALGEAEKTLIVARAQDDDGTDISGAWINWSVDDPAHNTTQYFDSQGILAQPVMPTLNFGGLGYGAPNILCAPAGAVPGTVTVTARLIRRYAGVPVDPYAAPGVDVGNLNSSVLPYSDVTFEVGTIPPVACHDVSGDGKVTLPDLIIVAPHYGTVLGDPGYVPLYDFNSDGHINLTDLIILAAAYGLTC